MTSLLRIVSAIGLACAASAITARSGSSNEPTSQRADGCATGLAGVGCGSTTNIGGG